MFTQQDLQQIASRGTTSGKVQHQLEQIQSGFPYLQLVSAAAKGNGIYAPEEQERKSLVETWRNYKQEKHRIVKFVPASGAASRMFKNMFAFLDAEYDTPQTAFEKEYFENIKKFAFREALCDKCRQNEGRNIRTLLQEGGYKKIVSNMLEAKGLNYGFLPKGLLLFHEYAEGEVRTPMEEHLVEAALYAESDGVARVHFTVSHEHLEHFKAKVNEKAQLYASRYGIQYEISFSEQKPSTDTVAANTDGTPFRNEDGSLLFRPGGHGALIENLNEIDADVLFIKNIDNVVPDWLKGVTVEYKEVIAGLLVKLQKQLFAHLKRLDEGTPSREELTGMLSFLENDLCCKKEDAASLSDEALAAYLHEKFNRPIRVCGMVKNVGEPGGGPFLVVNADGSVGLQILESTQIDKSNPEYARMFSEGTHFNPVDLVCATRNYKGEPFRLPDYVDPTTGFISQKSKSGRELLALELPGLWNGAMSNWNTVFVEVPLETFNPVKTVNDLLRPEHQQKA